MGLVMTNNDTFHDKLYKYQYCVGAVPSPFDCYLTLRGVKTLHIRMERQSYNSYKIYEFLKEKQMENKIGKIYYPPALKDNMHGGMISFELLKDITYIKKELPTKLNIIVVAESLGSVETLLCNPATMTHASVSKEHKDKIGITDNLLRISVGIENINDLINDLKNIID